MKPVKENGALASAPRKTEDAQSILRFRPSCQISFAADLADEWRRAMNVLIAELRANRSWRWRR